MKIVFAMAHIGAPLPKQQRADETTDQSQVRSRWPPTQEALFEFDFSGQFLAAPIASKTLHSGKNIFSRENGNELHGLLALWAAGCIVHGITVPPLWMRFVLGGTHSSFCAIVFAHVSAVRCSAVIPVSAEVVDF
jgi:hypothetical protein